MAAGRAGTVSEPDATWLVVAGGAVDLKIFPRNKKMAATAMQTTTTRAHHQHHREILFQLHGAVFRKRRGRPFAHFGARDDEFRVRRRRRLRHGDFLEARRALHHRACLRRIASDVLAAHRTGIFELTHDRPRNISHWPPDGNDDFQSGIRRSEAFMSFSGSICLFRLKHALIRHEFKSYSPLDLLAYNLFTGRRQ